MNEKNDSHSSGYLCLFIYQYSYQDFQGGHRIHQTQAVSIILGLMISKSCEGFINPKQHLVKHINSIFLNNSPGPSIFVLRLTKCLIIMIDPVVALEAALQFEDTQESMHAFCVGQYLEVRLWACFV